MSSKKLLAATLAAALLLSSCGKAATTETATAQKTPFYFESEKFADFSKTAQVSKIGRIVGSSSVTVSSQASGRIEYLPFKEGATVKKGQVIARLADTAGNYGIRLGQAQNGLKSAQVNTESTKIALDKAVSDAQTALNQAQVNYDKTVADAAKQLEKAARDAQKASVDVNGSDSQAALSKAELDYENLKKSDAKTIDNFAPTYRVTVSDFKKLVDSVLFDTDRLLGITDANRSYNDAFETYLGARNSATVTKAQNAYAQAVAVSQFLDSKANLTVDQNNVVSELGQLESKYAAVRALLDSVTDMLQNSVAATALPQTAIDGYLATYNGYKSSLSGLQNGFVSFRNSATTFLATYQNNEASAAAGLEVQKKNLASGQYDASVGYDRTKIALDAGIESSRLALESAKSNLKNAEDNRRTTLQKLTVSQTDASLQLSQAGTEFGKLTIVSPIDATVVKVDAQVGQDVSAGTPVVEISNRSPEVSLDVDSDTAGLLKTGSEVAVTSGSDSYTGTVVAVSNVANAALLFTVRIALSETPKLLGEAATVKIPLPSQYPIVPSDIVKILSEQEGELTAFSGGTFVPVPVKLGKLTSGTVEIVSGPSPDTEIVLTDVSNFDPKVSEPKKK